MAFRGATCNKSLEFTTQQVKSVRFGFFTDDEVSKISVKRITSPFAMDKDGNALEDGLLDPALGPSTVKGDFQRCTTCSLGPSQCPGHFGHIELPLPVFNPLVFGELHRLLKSICLNCNRFMMPPALVDQYVQKLQLLMQADLAAAEAVSLSKAAAAKDKQEPDDDMEVSKAAPLEDKAATMHDRAALESEEKENGERTAGPAGTSLTQQALQQIQDTIAQFWKSMSASRKCVVCGCFNPGIRKAGHTRFLVDGLGSRSRKANAEAGVSPASPLDKAAKAKLKGKDGDAEDSAEEVQAAKRARVAASNAAETSSTMIAAEVEVVLSQLWARHRPMMDHLYSFLYAVRTGRPAGWRSSRPGHEPWRMFFLRRVLVPPNKFRPLSVMGGQSYDHAQNVLLKKVLNSCLTLNSMVELQREGKAQITADAITTRWVALQDAVNTFIDSSTAERDDKSIGLRQLLERKEGLFRMNMMGKRVNFAARSVISPDPYIGGGEIGIPPYFAKTLNFPERVTPWNVQRLREMVERGVDKYPGAVAVEDELGRIVNLGALPKERRMALGKQLLASSAAADGHATARRNTRLLAAGKGKIVYRHVLDGDLLLTNRQPTLHKPSLMAHCARVLNGERTIRMHYVNCATFNADFDGDEINLHFPQDHHGRAEGYSIVHADHQYIVPTDGKPIRGLIQDHVVAAVQLTHRDCFLDRSHFMQMVYSACCSSRPRAQSDDASFAMPPPAVMKPQPLWTGKQVISTVVQHFTASQPQITVTAGCKLPTDYFAPKSSAGSFIDGETQFHFQTGHLVTGVFDKQQYGKDGLLHAVHELYGPQVAGKLLSSFSRLYTHTLQVLGFTCGYSDLVLHSGPEAQRAAILDRAEAAAVGASCDLLGVDWRAGAPRGKSHSGADEVYLALHQGRSARRQLQARYQANPQVGVAHDMKVSGAMHGVNSEAVKACFPNGLRKRFPANCMAMMTTTGAKGSQVNFAQISVLLGQQELEGRRVPRMASGKTLPSFGPYDPGARSGGFIADRFLVGLRPQEYYFHCMSGRDGLVDTAVKTARSGYLQRCIVKSLETLKVAYDCTVRDDTDGSIMQFAYGEDGIDVLAMSHLNSFKFLANNLPQLRCLISLGDAEGAGEKQGLTPMEAEVRRQEQQRRLALERAETGGRPVAPVPPVPVMAQFPPTLQGCTSEAFQDALHGFLSTCQNQDQLQDQVVKAAVHRAKATGLWTELKAAATSRAKRLGGRAGFKEAVRQKLKLLAAAQNPLRLAAAGGGAAEAEFRALMQLKYMKSLAAAGEAVGVVAAQSVGEPSTQMTLNTFHMAGRGEANVTLGIPRLRELLMTAAKSVATPVMTMMVRQGGSDGLHDAHLLANQLRRIRLAETLKSLRVEEQPFAPSGDGGRGYMRRYLVHLEFHDISAYPQEVCLTWEEISDALHQRFHPRLKREITRQLQRQGTSGSAISSATQAQVRVSEGAEATSGGVGGGEEGQDAEEGKEGSGAAAHAAPELDDEDVASEDENEEQNEEFLDGKARFAGGAGDGATYGGPDDEDQQVLDELDREQHGEATTASSLKDELDRQGQPEGSGTRAGPGAASVAGSTAKRAATERSKRKRSSSSASTLFEVELVEEDGEGYSCVAQVQLALDAPKLLMLEIAEDVAAATFVRETHGIARTYVQEGDDSKPHTVQTDGINLLAAWMSDGTLEVNSIRCNDVEAMRNTYGIEAARRTLVDEVMGVFGAYGIKVDPRHLSIIADYMTHLGGYRGCNRNGICASTSPLLKMSFETAGRYLTDSAVKGAEDTLLSPAARIVLGQQVLLGTGAVSLQQHL